MVKALIYCVLLIASLAMLLLVAGFCLALLGLSVFTAGCYFLAAKALLLAMGLLLLLAVAGLLKSVWRELRAYFKREASLLRRLFALGYRQRNALQRTVQEQRQLQYFYQVQRQRLLKANNRRHTRELYSALERELHDEKARLSVENYQALHKTLRLSYKKADAAAMLALRQQIPCR